MFRIFLFLLISKNLSAQSSQQGNGMIDSEGNFYGSVVLTYGVEWTTENLKSSHFSDGSSIENIQNNMEWESTTSPAYANFQNDSANSQVYGKLYNYYVVNDSRNICSEGWRVPSELDWTNLSAYLGGLGSSGGKLKMVGEEYWSFPNTEASDLIGFKALPNGCRYEEGYYNNLAYYSFFWTSSELDSTFAWYRSMKYNVGSMVRNYAKKQRGFAIRCIRDVNSGQSENYLKTMVCYPNPTKGQLFLNLSTELNILSVELRDLHGKAVKTELLFNQSLDLSNLESGWYRLNVLTKDGILSQNVLKIE